MSSDRRRSPAPRSVVYLLPTINEESPQQYNPDTPTPPRQPPSNQAPMMNAQVSLKPPISTPDESQFAADNSRASAIVPRDAHLSTVPIPPTPFEPSQRASIQSSENIVPAPPVAISAMTSPRPGSNTFEMQRMDRRHRRQTGSSSRGDRHSRGSAPEMSARLSTIEPLRYPAEIEHNPEVNHNRTFVLI